MSLNTCATKFCDRNHPKRKWPADCLVESNELQEFGARAIDFITVRKRFREDPAFASAIQALFVAAVWSGIVKHDETSPRPFPRKERSDAEKVLLHTYRKYSSPVLHLKEEACKLVPVDRSAPVRVDFHEEHSKVLIRHILGIVQHRP